MYTALQYSCKLKHSNNESEEFKMELKQNFLVRFNRRSGKIDKTMGSLGNALMQFWALQNTTKSKDTIIFDEDGIVHFYFEGTGDFPNVTNYDKLVEEEGYHHIDEFCEGLLEACKAKFAEDGEV